RSIQWRSGGGKLGHRAGPGPAVRAVGAGSREVAVAPAGAGRARMNRGVRGLLLAGAGLLAVGAWLLGRGGLGPAWIRLPADFRRRTASLYIDGLLVGYALALIGSIGLLIGVPAIRRLRRADTTARRRRHVRLLAAAVAVLLSVLALDLGA